MVQGALGADNSRASVRIRESLESGELMQRRQETKRRRVSPWTIVVGFVTLILAGQGGGVASWAADRPTIGGVEIGFGGRHKVGYWTPVRVEVSGAEPALRGRLELVTQDSEGMPVSYVVDEDEAAGLEALRCCTCSSTPTPVR